MANTQRTDTQLLSLFADNNIGGITAQDLRDLVVSKPNSVDLTAHESATGTSVHGLGTASTATLTTSTTDSTVGRALKVGDFGQGTFIKNYDLSAQIQTSNYRRSVIALCELTNTSVSLNSYSSGEITFHRSNSIVPEILCKIQVAKRYDTTQPNGFLEISSDGISAFPEVRLCTFTYNGIKYGGLHFYCQAARHSDIVAKLSGNFIPFGLDYYDTQTSTPINSEVYNSISLTDYYQVQQGHSFHQGNILGTVSQSAGVPTGAIIERGSNSNGEYVKYADGTYVSWGNRIFTLSSSVAGGAYFHPFDNSMYDFSDNMPLTVVTAKTTINSIVGDPTTDGSSDSSARTYIWWEVVADREIFYTNRARNSGIQPTSQLYKLESEAVTGAISINSTIVSWTAVGRWF
jgi:hypothetical protein